MLFRSVFALLPRTTEMCTRSLVKSKDAPQEGCRDTAAPPIIAHNNNLLQPRRTGRTMLQASSRKRTQLLRLLGMPAHAPLRSWSPTRGSATVSLPGDTSRPTSSGRWKTSVTIVTSAQQQTFGCVRMLHAGEISEHANFESLVGMSLSCIWCMRSNAVVDCELPSDHATRTFSKPTSAAGYSHMDAHEDSMHRFRRSN